MYPPRGGRQMSECIQRKRYEGKRELNNHQPAVTPRRKSRKEAKPRSNANARPTGMEGRRGVERTEG